jgi:hypothetical protein
MQDFARKVRHEEIGEETASGYCGAGKGAQIHRTMPWSRR